MKARHAKAKSPSKTGYLSQHHYEGIRSRSGAEAETYRSQALASLRKLEQKKARVKQYA